MFLVACAIAVLCVVSLSHSAPLACEELVRPLDQLNPHRLEGRWALIAGSLSHPPYLARFKQRDSATVNFFSNTSETNISYTRSILLDGKCSYTSYNISLQGGSFTFDSSNATAAFIRTSCHDCILMRFGVESGKQHFYLFSRRRQLEQEEMEEFKSQVECLNMPSPVVMDPIKELCPDPTAQTEE